MTYAIKAEGLGKCYLIGHQRKEAYGTLRDSIVNGAKNFLHRIRHPNIASSGPELEEFWALRDVSFEISPGDRVGIIGRNGAGKSTLLKILSRITEPTTGRFTTRGRVASLLEVGTGFHPELSGRDNIFLNGAILGMPKADVLRQFDAIVDFSGVEKFLDTPVKRYSSGMYVRLAFAVAAHLDPDILIVDEVLAVGDAEFQKKCLGKMEDAGKEGRTVVFVSHNMATVKRLCSSCYELDKGSIAFHGSTDQVLNHYCSLSDITASNSRNLSNRTDRVGSQKLKIHRALVCSPMGQPIDILFSGQPVQIKFEYTSSYTSEESNILFAFNIKNSAEDILLNMNTMETGFSKGTLRASGSIQCLWEKCCLRSGIYSCDVFCSINGEIVDWVSNAFSLTIEDGDFFHTGFLLPRDQANFLSNSKWTFSE